MIEFTAGEIEAYYRVRVPGLRQIQGSTRGPCPVHGGKDLNFSVDPKTGQSYCHSQCARGWDVISLEMELSAVDFIKAKAEVFGIVGRPKPNFQERDIEATYDYTAADGKVLYQVVRRTGKKFSQRRPAEGRSGWQWGLGGVEPVPFRLPRFKGAELLACVEGEKDVINLERVGWTATCNNGGAGNFKPDLVPYFTGKHIAIFPDNDEPGRKHAEHVAALLHPVALSVRIVEIPDLPLKGDVSDYLKNGNTGEDLYKLYERTQDWTPEWKFTTDVPHENDKYLRSFAQAVAEAGGHDKFWESLDVRGIPTPWHSLTEKLNGLKTGEVYILGANQGQGKTSLALQFAIAALEKKFGTLIFSMEMAHRDVFQRMAAIEARVNLAEYRQLKREYPQGMALARIQASLRAATMKFANTPLFVTTKSGVTPEFLIEETKRVKDRTKIDLVIIDHMQLMATTGKVRSDYEKFTAISRTTKGIAADLGVPLLLISQCSRANSSLSRSELEMSDLRGSGALEEDAAVVMLLYYDRDDFEAAKSEPHRLAGGPIRTKLKIAKNRYGVSGAYEDLLHLKAETRFVQESRRGEDSE